MTPPSLSAALDHLVYAAPDLEAAAADLGRQLGVEPAPGGRHLGLGTANRLLALGPASYLEVIGPDPTQPPPARSRPFGMDRLGAPRLVGWAVRTTTIEERAAAARRRGFDPGPIEPMSRDRPEGGRLTWRLSTPTDEEEGVQVVPFLIDWGESPHPAASAPAGTRLLSLGAEHPDPGAALARLAALDVALEVLPGPEPSLAARLESPFGRCVLR